MLDIEKLKKFHEKGNNSGFDTLFCALVDAWPKNRDNDDRIKKVEKDPKVLRVLQQDQGALDFFATTNYGYSGQICGSRNLAGFTVAVLLKVAVNV